MRPVALVSWLRPAGPVAVGISLGFTLSLLSISWVEEPCPESRDSPGVRVRHANSVPARPEPPANPDSPAVPDNPDSYQPRIVPYKAARNKKPSKKTVRTRYISTELGMRERLLVGVLTSKTTLNTLGVAVNRTLATHTDKVLFFTGVRGRRLPHGMYVVTHGEERPVWNMYHTLRYVFEHHAGEYDWFYFTPDNTYTQGDRLRALVEHMSIDTDLYMGRPHAFIAGDGTGSYCRAEFGFLLSRQLLTKLQPHLDSCRTDIVSSRHDEWLGRCVLDYLAVTCTHLHQGSRYRFYELGEGGERDGEEGARFRGAMTLHPVLEPVQMFLLHKRFTQLELEHTYRQIQALQEELRNVSGLDSVAEAGVQGPLDNWPLGIQSPFRPGSRFEVLRWEYFSEERLCWCADGSPQCPLRGADRLDVAAIVATAVSELNRRHAPWLELTKERLVNGYRRFDPTRGMEYTLDLRLRAATARGRSASITRRVHLLRPLGPLDIVPMPHVTEAARVHLLLPITSGQCPEAGPFLRHYADTALVSGDNALLTLVLVYSPAEAQRLGTDDVFATVKAELGQWERRYPGSRLPWVSVRSLSPAPLRIIDLVSRRQAADTLLMLLSVAARPGPEMLNRCRMNAISQHQVFFPVPFQEFTLGSGPGSGSGRPELLRDSGRFDRDSFTTACFYNADYMAARVRAAAAPANPAALAFDPDELLDGLDLYQLFLQFSGLHVLRAAEPALLHAAGRRHCHPPVNDDLYQRCRHSDLMGLGSRGQLAALLFPPEHGDGT